MSVVNLEQAEQKQKQKQHSGGSQWITKIRVVLSASRALEPPR